LAFNPRVITVQDRDPVEVYDNALVPMVVVSRITLPDGPVIAEFDGLPSSASRVL